MIDDTKTLLRFSNYGSEESIYLKLSPEYLDFLKFLEEKNLLDGDWSFENIKEIKIYEF